MENINKYIKTHIKNINEFNQRYLNKNSKERRNKYEKTIK